MISYLFLNGQRLIIIACEQAHFLGKGWKKSRLGRAKALAGLVSDRYFVEKEVSLNPESFAGILKVISSRRTCRLYISYCGEDISLWTAKQSKPIAFRKTKLSTSYVSKHGEMSVHDVFKKESLLRNYHVLCSLWTGSLGSLRYGDHGLRTTAGRGLSFVCSTWLSRAIIER